MDLMSELNSSKKEIFRFEALQEYFSNGKDRQESELSRQWREKKEIDMDLMKEWHDFISKKHQEKVKFTWVRLVEFPLNEYTKSSLYIYKRRIVYGIDIRIIAKQVFENLKIPIKDFYTIDNKVILMNYGKSNEFSSCELDKDSKKYNEYKRLLIENSTPVSNFNY